MSSRLQLFDYFFLTRPILFIPGWTTLLVGYIAAWDGMRLFSPFMFRSFQVEWGNLLLTLGLIAFSCAMGGCFVLNQLQDIQSDVKNNKLFLLGNGFVSAKAGYIESYLLISFSILIAFLVNPLFLFLIVVFNTLTGYAYNFPPFVLKNKAVLGLFANMVMGWLAFSLGWALIKPINPDLLLNSLPVLFFNTSLYLLTTVPDIKGDQKSAKFTFPVKYGLKFTVILCLFFFILALVTSLWHKNDFILVVSISTLPFMINVAWQQNTASSLVAVKSGITWLALLVCLKCPSFFLLLAVLYFFTRFYYKNRFDFSYPNFKGR